MLNAQNSKLFIPVKDDTIVFPGVNKEHVLRLRRSTETFWMVDGIKIVEKMTPVDKDKALKAFVKYINGKWLSDSLKQTRDFKFSTQFYTGHSILQTNNGIDTTDAKLDIIKGWVCYINFNNGQAIDTSLIRFKIDEIYIGKQLYFRTNKMN